jgi:hypothetical protein
LQQPEVIRDGGAGEEECGREEAKKKKNVPLNILMTFSYFLFLIKPPILQNVLHAD